MSLRADCRRYQEPHGTRPCDTPDCAGKSQFPIGRGRNVRYVCWACLCRMRPARANAILDAAEEANT